MSEELGGDAQRTLLAAERTWLAWWRTAIGVAAAAIAVGAVIPRIVDASRLGFGALGIGYALLAIAVFIGAGRRQAAVKQALEDGRPVEIDVRWVKALSGAGIVLSLATVALIVIES